MNTLFLRQPVKSLGKLLIPVFFFFAAHLNAQLIGWDASNNGGGFGASPWAPVTLNGNLTMSNTGLIRGSGIMTSGTPAGGCWGGGGGGWGTTDPGSVYFSFTANAGYKVSLSSISSALRRSSSGPTTCNVEYSLNGGAYTLVGTWNVSSTSGTTGTANSTNLSAVALLQNVAAGTVIKFRISFPGASGGNWYLTGSTNSLRLNGTVVAVPSCTAPVGLAPSNVTTSSADLNWNSISGVSGYEYVIDQTSALPAGTGTAVTTNSCAAAGLNPGTVYYAHIRTDCGSGYSTWTTTSFTTVAGCVSPSVTAVTSSTAVCVGAPLSLSVTAAGTSLTYTWTGAGAFSSANTASTTVTNPGSSDYTVSISNACGTASTAVSVTVNTLPSVTSNSLLVCAGSTGTLTAAGAATYSWSTGQAAASATVSPVSNSVYTVTGTDLNGCSATYTTAVAVNALPAVGANSPSVCAGSTTTLTANGASTYTWNATQAATSITVNPTANTIYTVAGTDLNGCVNTATSQVTVHALPPVTANSPTVCAGSATSLTATGADTYTWNATQAAATITVAPTAGAIYSVTGTDLAGCVNTFTTQVTVNALPPVSANSPSVCAGGTTTLTATGANTYTWNAAYIAASITVGPTASTAYTLEGTDLNGCLNSFTTQVTVNALPAVSANAPSVCAGGTTTLTATGATTYTWSTAQAATSITVSPTANTVYTVTGTDGNGCVNSFTTQVTMSAAPVITVNSSTICSGTTATLTASGVSSYTWSTGSNSSSVTASPTAATVYTVSGNLAGCPVTVTQTATITVSALPSVSIAAIASALCNTTGTVNLSGSPFGGTFTGTGIVGNTFSPLVAGTGTFVVSYSYTGANACSGIAHTNIIVANCTGVEELTTSPAFEVYPNPASDDLHVSFPDQEARSISIYSMNGELVYSEKVNAMQHTLHLGELSKGLYVLKVNGAEGQSSKKILVQ